MPLLVALAPWRERRIVYDYPSTLVVPVIDYAQVNSFPVIDNVSVLLTEWGYGLQSLGGL